LYQGHGSSRLTTADGRVIFIDPYVGDGYDLPADIILVTHQHDDHNKTALVTQKPGCVIISNVEALEGGKHNTITVGDIAIEAVEASNGNHDPAQCVGFIVTADGIKVYFSGDTSMTKDMETYPEKKIDYVLLPCDGYYNMGPKEASECAKLIGARYSIPIHIKPGELYSKELAETFDAPNRLLVAAGEEIELTKAE